MRICIAAFLLIATGSSAFMAPASRARFVGMSAISEPEIMSESNVEDTAVPESASSAPADVPEPVAAVASPVVPSKAAAVDPRKQIQPGRYDSVNYSLTLPFFQRPANLDGSHAGDYGFDPLGFSQEFDLYYMQECELRHARLAMLAAVGWPMSELLAPDWMLQDGRAPSVLNGVNPLSFISILTALAALGFFEYKTSLRRNVDTKLGDIHRQDMALVWKYGVAGDYNFDPYNLYSSLGDDAIGRKALREVEVSHGRYAMVGITYFAAWEAFTGSPIVENNPLLHPNALVPMAAISYFIWSQFYQVSDVRNYPIKVEYTKDGEEMLRGIDRTLDGIDFEPAQKVAEVVFDAVGKLVRKVKSLQDENTESSNVGLKDSASSLIQKVKDLQESA